jgi:diketogulonate reductase-like aldo/keto reductase
LAWSPLGGGDEAARLGEFYPDFSAVGEKHDASAQEVALAWLIAQGPSLIPIPAFTRAATAESAATALFLQLDADDLARLNSSAPGPGSVYPD